MFRGSLYRFLEGSWPWGRLFTVFIMVLVLANLVLMVVTSVDSIYYAHVYAFELTEAITVGIFTLEYMLRLYSCVENPKMGRLGPLWGRLRWMVTFQSVVDLVAIVPYYVLLAVAFENNQFGFFGAVRVLRIFRLLKLERLTRAFKFIKVAILNVGEILLLTLILEGILFFAISALLYVVEPSIYPSIPAAMYTAALMVVGVQTPDESRLSALGKVVVALFVVLGLTLFVLPTGVLMWGFQNVGEKYLEQKHKREKKSMPPSAATSGGGEMVRPEEPNSDEELFGKEEEEAAAPAATTESSPLLQDVEKASLCPTCGHYTLSPPK